MMSRNNNLTWVQAAAAMLLVGLLGVMSSCSKSDEAAPVLHIIHTNDTHSQIDPLEVDMKPSGGARERAAFIEMACKEDPETMYFDAGDMMQGTPYYNIYKGKVEVELMNMQGLIATTLGNHEFDNGMESLDSVLQARKFKVLCCNYDCKGTPLERDVEESMIIERKGVKIGITGVSTDPDNLIFKKNWQGITYYDPSDRANRVAANLRAKGCDLIILISHVGYSHTEDNVRDRRIARNSTEIDLIIGGHSHTNIENGVEVLNKNGRPVMITQTGAKAEPIGRIEIQMQKNTRDTPNKWMVKEIRCSKLHPEMYDLSSYAQNIEDFIMPYRNSIEDQMNQEIGYSDETLKKGHPQSAQGNLIADIIYQCGLQLHPQQMDLSVMNYGGIRAPLSKGPITMGDIFRIHPFENYVTVCSMTGATMERLIKQTAGKRLECFGGPIEIHLETHKDKTEATKILCHGKPIQPDSIYWVTTLDYVAEGNDGMTAFMDSKSVQHSGLLIRDVVIDYVKAQAAAGKHIKAREDGRVVMDN